MVSTGSACFDTVITCPSCKRDHKPKLMDTIDYVETDYITDEETGHNYDMFAEYHLLRCNFCSFVFELYRDEIVEGGEDQTGRWRQTKLLKVNEGTGFEKPILFPVDILDSIVILECDNQTKQGTAFKLNGIGFVTCAHVLSDRTKAFTKKNISKKYNIKTVASNDVLDLAILEIPELEHIKGFDPCWDAELNHFNEVFVAGFPNYRPGDTGTIVMSAISGFRMVSTVRRILISGPIIAGNSGGPGLLRNGEVFGVAVTGADRMEDSGETEYHGMVPIDQVKWLFEQIQKPQGV
ncbi:serine protease [Paenibacillus sp. GYB004]|uniref:S1 family peptidase n=1 Tax=Paenibacillus sp. GYB004 TaxID=2994393 RepID=UPI002F9674B7